MIAPLPEQEAERLKNLRAYRILDTLPEEDFERLTALAAQICGVPVSLISLVDEDRQWFKAQRGLAPDLRQTSRDVAFCAHNILDPRKALVVRDARQDHRFADNALVQGDPHIVFYAGVPLVSREGHALGSLCVIDRQPRELSQAQLTALEHLAVQVVKLFELRQLVAKLEERQREREAAYALLREFSHIIAHDLKAPIRNILQLGEALQEDFTAELPAEANKLLRLITERAEVTMDMVDGVLRYSQLTHGLIAERGPVIVSEIVDLAVRQSGTDQDCAVEYRGEVAQVVTSRIALLQILQNLIGNARKFNDKPDCCITVDCQPEPQAQGVRFRVSDNGPGIPADELEAVFRLFHRATAGSGQRGHGVGLAIVKRLVEALGGSIDVRSESGQGASFSFTLPEGTDVAA